MFSGASWQSERPPGSHHDVPPGRIMTYDAIILGGGHNGLVAAAYLARKGRQVCVLERRHVLGGCSSTEELWPGFRASPAAYVISLFLPSILEDLSLRRHGLEILPRDPSSFTPLPDGRSLLLGHDAVANRREISRFSRRDAEAYPRYEAFLTRVAQELEPILMKPAPRLPPRLTDLRRLWEYRRALTRLGADLEPAMELLSGAATPVLERWFESDVLRAVLATDAIIGAFASPSMPGSAYVLLHHVMGEAGGKRGVWGYVRGGMGGLANALVGSCRELGVEVRLESEVKRIEVDGGRARGVLLADGTALEAPTVVSSIDAHHTFLGLVGEEHLPAEFVAAVRRIDYASASAKINLALDGLPAFRTGDVPPEVALRGTVHMAPTLEYIERAYEDARQGRFSEHPVIEMTLPSTLDSSLAPPGKHVASLFVQYAPYTLADGGWTDARRDAFGERVIDTVCEYAPDFRERILGLQVLTPPDLERVYGLKGGNIFQGAMHLHQLGPLRTDCRTPVPGLWLCGAATHPGGGVLGACGRNAAAAILRVGR